jgi:hypothetical protein
MKVADHIYVVRNNWRYAKFNMRHRVYPCALEPQMEKVSRGKTDYCKVYTTRVGSREMASFFLMIERSGFINRKHMGNRGDNNIV